MIDAASYERADSLLAFLTEVYCPKTNYQRQVWGFVYARRAFIAYQVRPREAAALYKRMHPYLQWMPDTLQVQVLRWTGASLDAAGQSGQALSFFLEAERLALAYKLPIELEQIAICRQAILRRDINIVTQHDLFSVVGYLIAGLLLSQVTIFLYQKRHHVRWLFSSDEDESSW